MEIPLKSKNSTNRQLEIRRYELFEVKKEMGHRLNEMSVPAAQYTQCIYLSKKKNQPYNSNGK